MKKQILLALMILCSDSLFAQITGDTIKNLKVSNPVVSTNLKVIPSSRAVMIRKDVVNIKTQLITLRDSVARIKRESDALIETMKNDLDSMSEMSEMESLRLQMMMDRLSKMMSTLSNILKKISDTQKTITQNLK